MSGVPVLILWGVPSLAHGKAEQIRSKIETYRKLVHHVEVLDALEFQRKKKTPMKIIRESSTRSYTIHRS